MKHVIPLPQVQQTERISTAEKESRYNKALGLPPLPGELHSNDEGANAYSYDMRNEKGLAEEEERLQALAVQVIWNSWTRYKMRLEFRQLKDCLYKAEQSVTFEILRKLSPPEADLLRDPVIQSRVRFRLGGDCWPPKILYKIYTRGRNVHYFSGSKFITAGSQAAVDSCMMMGPRLYTEGMILEDYQTQAYKISAAVDVTNHMEFVQYLNSLDTMPACIGGRNNGWRELSVTPMSKPSILLDIFYKTQIRTPCTRHREIQKIVNTQMNNGKIPLASEVADRQCQRRRKKIRRFRKLYGFIDPMDQQDSDIGLETQVPSPDPHVRSHLKHGGKHSEDWVENMDEDFVKLFEWTNDLSIQELDLDDNGHNTILRSVEKDEVGFQPEIPA